MLVKGANGAFRCYCRNIPGVQGQYRSCCCPDSSCHRVINSWYIDWVRLMGLCLTLLSRQILIAGTISVSRDKVNVRYYDDVIKWKYFPRYWPFVRGIHRSPVNSPHKGQWRGAFIVSLICACINGWVNNRKAGDLRRHLVRYNATVMVCMFPETNSARKGLIFVHW